MEVNLAYLGSAYLAGAVLLVAAAAIFRSNIRVESAASWVLLAFVGPVPAVVAQWLTGLVGMPSDAAIPVAALATLMSVLIMHFLLPALLPDFQTANFATSMMLGVLVGLSVLGAGLATNAFPGGMMTAQQDAFGTEAVKWDDSAVTKEAQ